MVICREQKFALMIFKEGGRSLGRQMSGEGANGSCRLPSKRRHIAGVKKRTAALQRDSDA